MYYPHRTRLIDIPINENPEASETQQQQHQQANPEPVENQPEEGGPEPADPKSEDDRSINFEDGVDDAEAERLLDLPQQVDHNLPRETRTSRNHPVGNIISNLSSPVRTWG